MGTNRSWTVTPPGARYTLTTHIIDASEADQEIDIGPASLVPEETTVRIISIGGGLVTVREGGQGLLTKLQHPGAEVSRTSDGATWRTSSRAAPQNDLRGLAFSVLSAELDTLRRGNLELEQQLMALRGQILAEAEAAAGEEYQRPTRHTEADLEAKIQETTSTGVFVAPQITEIHDTSQDDRVVQFTPGSANPVNWWVMTGAGTGDPITLYADGSDTDVDISLLPKGAGQLKEGLTSVALNCGSAQSDSAAVVLATLVTDFNALLAKLRTARILDP